MKKRTSKLTRNRETVANISAPALRCAVGGKIRQLMATEANDCIYPVPKLGPGRILRLRILR